MAFERESTKIDLGDTAIENIFINDFMPIANGTFVKVYLLGYKYSLDPGASSKTNEVLARNLNIPISDVLSAWDFWEEKGIIVKEDIDLSDPFEYKVKFINLKELYIRNNISLYQIEEAKDREPEKRELTPKDLVEAAEIPRINQMFNFINDLKRRQLVPNEKKKILEWILDYNMDPDLVEKAFEYSISKDKNHINYVEGVIRNWYDEGITDIESVNRKIEEEGGRFALYNKIFSYLGFHRPINQGEKDIIDRWVDEYKFDQELIMEACKAVTKTSNPSIRYIDGVVSDWFKKGIKTREDIALLDKKEENKVDFNKRNKKNDYTTKFHNFQGRSKEYTAEELSQIASEKMEEYIRKIEGGTDGEE